MGFLKRKTKHGTFMCWWGKWQQSTHLTRPGANTVNLSVPSSLHMHAYTPPCSTVMCVKASVELSRGPIHANQEPRGRRVALFGMEGGGEGGGRLTAICGKAKYTTGTVWILTEGVCVCVCMSVNLYLSRKHPLSAMLFSSDILTHIQTHIHLNCQKQVKRCRSGYTPASFIL